MVLRAVWRSALAIGAEAELGFVYAVSDEACHGAGAVLLEVCAVDALVGVDFEERLLAAGRRFGADGGEVCVRLHAQVDDRDGFGFAELEHGLPVVGERAWPVAVSGVARRRRNQDWDRFLLQRAVDVLQK